MKHKFFYVKNSHTNCEDKKSWGLRPTNLNLLYEIKLHRFIWLLYPKDLFFSTYNLIHVCDTVTLDCLVDHFSLAEGMKVFKPIFKKWILEWDIENGVTL